MSRRALWLLAGLVALVAAVGVTTAVAGSATREATPATKATTAKRAKSTKPAEQTARAEQAATTGGVTQGPAAGTNAAAEYWTPERMQNVQAREMTTPGGSPAVAPAQSPKGARAAPTTNKRTQKAVPAKKRTTSKRARAAAQDAVTGGQSTGNAAEHWTPARMADVTPMGKTAPGGDGSNEASDQSPRGASIP